MSASAARHKPLCLAPRRAQPIGQGEGNHGAFGPVIAGRRTIAFKETPLSEDMSWLIAREIPRLRRYARGLVKDATRADDLVQDALERALRKQGQVRNQGSLRGWLLRIVYTVYLNGRKSHYAPPSLSLDDDDTVVPHPSTPARQFRQLECATILEALDQLPHTQRDAILLVALEGLPYDQAAQVLGVEVGTLKSRLSRGREALRELTGKNDGRGVPTLRRIK